MIVLDTNILSELMKTTPDRQVEYWVEQQEAAELFITTVSIAEISYGINLVPNGKRRKALEYAWQHTVNNAFRFRIFPFDEKAANAYGLLMSKRKQSGKPMGTLDGQIAAIAQIHSAVLATRNIRDFNNCDLELINPFEN